MEILDRDNRRSGGVHDDGDEIQETPSNENATGCRYNQHMDRDVDDDDDDLFLQSDHNYNNSRRFSDFSAASVEPEVTEPIIQPQRAEPSNQVPLTEDEMYIEKVMKELNSQDGLLADYLERSSSECIDLDSDSEKSSGYTHGGSINGKCTHMPFYF